MLNWMNIDKVKYKNIYVLDIDSSIVQLSVLLTMNRQSQEIICLNEQITFTFMV